MRPLLRRMAQPLPVILFGATFRPVQLYSPEGLLGLGIQLPVCITLGVDGIHGIHTERDFVSNREPSRSYIVKWHRVAEKVCPIGKFWAHITGNRAPAPVGV